MVDHENPWNAFIDRFKKQIHREGGRNNIIPMVKQSFRNLVNYGIDGATFILGLQKTVREMNDIMTDDQLEALNQDILKLRDEYNAFIQSLELEEEPSGQFKEQETLAAKIGTAASDQAKAKAWYEKNKDEAIEKVKARNKQKTDKASAMEAELAAKEKQYETEAAKINEFENDKLKGIFGV